MSLIISQRSNPLSKVVHTTTINDKEKNEPLKFPNSIMDNPCYFQSSSLPETKEVSEQDLLATLEVNDKEARKNLDESLSLLNSRISNNNEAPSVKLMKKCSIRRLLNGKSKPPIARSQSLTHTQNPNGCGSDDFIVERSKSFSATSSMTMSHHLPSTAQKRSSLGSVCIQRQPTTVQQGKAHNKAFISLTTMRCCKT